MSLRFSVSNRSHFLTISLHFLTISLHFLTISLHFLIVSRDSLSVSPHSAVMFPGFLMNRLFYLSSATCNVVALPAFFVGEPRNLTACSLFLITLQLLRTV